MAARKYLVRVLSIGLALAFALAGSGGSGVAQDPGPQTESSLQAALGTAFTYQGRLTDGGSPANGSYDLRFTLYDAAVGGSQVGSTVSVEDVTVADGLFSAQVDFGSGVFGGEARYLEVAVRPGSSTGDHTVLGPRQPLTAAPYALYALGAPWSGLTAVPAGLDDGDDDTTYTAGDGLTLADTEFSADTSYLQRRVGGECAVGSTIWVINADGTVVCQSDAPLNRPMAPRANVITALDSAGYVGSYTSVTIGSDGLGLIGYQDSTNGELKVAHCNDLACTGATTATLDSGVYFGACTSVTIGSDGLGLFSYWTGGCVKVAHCNDVACTGATVTCLDRAGGYCTSVTIGSDGLGLISYRHETTGDLKVGHCNDVTCTGVISTTLDSAGFVGDYCALTIGSDGLGLISYYDSTNSALKVAHCNDLACTGATLTTLDSAGSVGSDTSVTIGSDGLGLISYRDGTNDALKVAHCNDLACTSAITTTLDSTGVGKYGTSVTIGSDGLGLISYYDGTNGDLKVAHCANPFCVPYFRRR